LSERDIPEILADFRDGAQLRARDRIRLGDRHSIPASPDGLAAYRKVRTAAQEVSNRNLGDLGETEPVRQALGAAEGVGFGFLYPLTELSETDGELARLSICEVSII